MGRTVTGNELQVLFEQIAAGESTVDLFYQKEKVDHSLFEQLFPGATATWLAFDFGVIEENSEAQFVVIFGGLTNFPNVPTNATVKVTVKGEVSVSRKTSYRVDITSIVSHAVVLATNETGTSPTAGGQTSRRFSGNLPTGFYAKVIPLLDRGRRDFHSTKWVDAVTEVLESDTEIFDTSWCNAYELESAIWLSNLFRRTPIEELMVGVNPSEWAANVRPETITLLKEVELYLQLKYRAWIDRWFTAFNHSVEIDGVTLISHRYQYIQDLLKKPKILSYADHDTDVAARTSLEKELATHIASIQHSNMSQEVAKKVAAVTSARTASTLNPSTDVEEVDFSKTAPITSFELKFLKEEDKVVLHVEDPLSDKWVVAKVITNDKEAIDFRALTVDQETFTAYASERVSNTNVYENQGNGVKISVFSYQD